MSVFSLQLSCMLPPPARHPPSAPADHIYGLVVILNLGIMQGVKTVTMPKFDPGNITIVHTGLQTVPDTRRGCAVPPVAMCSCTTTGPRLQKDALSDPLPQPLRLES